jgi:hypothetical protein
MKHASIRGLFEYWNERRGPRPAPDRIDIEPGAIRHLLADTFILAYDHNAGHPFRIAGTRVCGTFGRELKGEPFIGLWTAPSQALMRDLLAVVGQESVGVVAGAHGNSAAGAALDLELVMLPLSHRGRFDVGVLGALAPSETVYWLGASALGPLTLGTLRYLSPERPVPTPAAGHILSRAGGRRVRQGFVVYDGGQP